jgi:hypothetical protein
VLDQVSEVARDGKLLPQPASGLPTAVYSFDDSSRLRSHMGQMVEVRGRIKDIRDSEIEVKPVDERRLGIASLRVVRALASGR